jgi:hypothetical protein
LKIPDLNCTDFGEKTINFTDFVEKNLVCGMFYLLFVRKKFFDPNLRGGSPEKFVLRKKSFGKNMEKIWLNLENMAPW